MGYKTNELCRSSLYDRIKKLLVSYEWSDCCFSVSGKDFKAHKLILGISSPVFEAMFYGPLSKDGNIMIPDIEPETFQLLLNYMYTDSVEITSIEEAFELLYASRKYILEQLSDICVEYIKTNMSIDNVTTILNYPEFMQDAALYSAALKLFCEHAKYLLQNKNSISISCLKCILESEQINIDETDLIKYVFEWTSMYCEQNNLPKSIENKREILIKNDLFKLLRFCTLSLEVFEDLAKNLNNLLLPCEIDRIKKLIISRPKNVESGDISSICTVSKPRNPLKLQWFLCHRRPLRSVAPIIIDSNNYLKQARIKTNKSVFITSLCVPTRMAPLLNFRNNAAKVYSEEISVSVLCETDNSVVKFTNFMNTVEYDSMVDIELSEPCFIKNDKWYTIRFEWPQNRFLTYSYMMECRERIYNDHKLTIEFEDISLRTGTIGSFLAGLKFCL